MSSHHLASLTPKVNDSKEPDLGAAIVPDQQPLSSDEPQEITYSEESDKQLVEKLRADAQERKRPRRQRSRRMPHEPSTSDEPLEYVRVTIDDLPSTPAPRMPGRESHGITRSQDHFNEEHALQSFKNSPAVEEAKRLERERADEVRPG